jgi:hypothetical protein
VETYVDIALMFGLLVGLTLLGAALVLLRVASG